MSEVFHIYDTETDTFFFPVDGGLYIMVDTGKTLKRPEDHPMKNTTVYKASFIDRLSQKQIVICEGREAECVAKIALAIFDASEEADD